MTPPSLLGIDRKIAYTHKKYHSGLICTGVTKGLAIRKFSGSVKKFGEKQTSKRREVVAKKNPTVSLTE